MKQLPILLGSLLFSLGALAADPSVFAPGVISGPANEMAPAFTPDGKTVYFTRHNGDDYDILVSHWEGGAGPRPRSPLSRESGVTWNRPWRQMGPI